MKNKILKKLSLLALIFTLVISLAACGNKDNTNSDDKASSNDGISQLESDLMPSQNNNSSANSNASQQNSQNGSSNTSDAAKITKDEAKKIALKDANLKENEITDFEIELDRENDTLVYDISFDKGNEDYDYHIDANSGKIIKKDKDTND